MKHEFLQPRFEGARFAEHTLPLEVARDLAAYETLVVELAKHLYIKDHPNRQRVPKGFDADFHLHLEKVDEGSARPLLSLVTAGVLIAGTIGNGYFERAKGLISECIAAPEGQLPEAFPRELLSHFNQLGRSLRADERMELPRDHAPAAVLTPERRKRLVLAADRVYEREVELSGVIGEADWEKNSFRLRLADGDFTVVPMPHSFHSQARMFGGRDRHLTVLKGVGAFDSWDRLQKVVSVESLDVQLNYQIASRIDALAALEDGWFDGRGRSPDKERLSSVGEALISDYPETVPVPAIVPTQEGNLLFEWNLPGDPSIDINLGQMRGSFHSLRDDGTEIEREFDLDAPQKWGALFTFLVERLGGLSA